MNAYPELLSGYRDIPRDGVTILHDTESSAGDDGELRDLFSLDRSEARELGVELDPVDGPEAELD